MRYFVLLNLYACVLELECEYPIMDPIPANTELISCEIVEEGCSFDTLYCKGTYTRAVNPYIIITDSVYWIRHLNEDLRCAGYQDCVEVYEFINDWCTTHSECWREDRLPSVEF